MNAIAGVKRKLEAGSMEEPEVRKRRAAESPCRDSNERESDSGSHVDMGREQETSSWDEGEEEDLEFEGDSPGDVNEFSDREREDDEDDEDDEGYDEFEEFKWLKSINVKIEADDAADSPQAGFCVAKLIDRDYIRATFHRDMEEPSNDTATIGFGVFDRWGCLKPQFMSHPVKKGTGVWGPELNEGRFLQIELLSVRKSHRRKGYGKKLFEQVWAKAQDLAMQEDKDRRAARKKWTEKVWRHLYRGGEAPRDR